MQIELTPEQNSYVALGIEEGRFRDSQDAVQQALAQWEKRERARTELHSSLDLAEQSLDAGAGEEYTLENLKHLVSAIEERGRTQLNGQ